MLRSWVWAMVALFAILLIEPADAAPKREDSNPRIVAVGDLHGDYDAWLAIARGASLIDRKGRWAGGKTTLVQVGDIVDRAPDSLKIIHHLMKLQSEAARHGGRVVVLVGNHEAMMMTHDLRYVHPGEYAAFVDRNSEKRREALFAANRPAIEAAYRARDPALTADAVREAWFRATPLGMVEHQLAWQPTGELGSWTIANPAVIKLGDSLFVHGGISSVYATQTMTQINRLVAIALKNQDASPTAIINDPLGPLWYRGLVTRSEADEQDIALTRPVSAAPRPAIAEEIELVLRFYGVKRIVVGHTPSKAGIIEAEGGKLWRIDSANSKAYGGPPSFLEIIGDHVTAHKVARQ
jgi:hypothetical protein